MRYDIDQLSREVLEALTINLIEIKPDHFLNKGYEKFNSFKPTYIKNYDERADSDKYDPEVFHKAYVRRVSSSKGWNIYVERFERKIVKLVWNTGNMKYLKDGYNARYVTKKKGDLFIFIKNSGDVMYKRKNKFVTLSMSNYKGLNGRLYNNDITQKLLTIKDDKQWLYDLLSIKSKAIANHPSVLIGKNLYDKCSSLQEFIDNCNTRDHYIGAQWFNECSIEDIVSIMALPNDPTIYFSSAVDYLNFVETSGSDFNAEKIQLQPMNLRRRQVVIP